MYYNRLKKILAEKNITVKELCDMIGYSEGGFYQSVKNQSFKIATFELISKELNIPMTYWFMEESETVEGFQGNDKLQIQLITHLQEKVADLKDQIELYKKLTKELEQKVEDLRS